MKDTVYVVATTATPVDIQYFGDVMLVTTDKTQADSVCQAFNSGHRIDGVERDFLVENDGVAVVFERQLGKVIKTEY